MKKLILVLMAMLLMAGIASADGTCVDSDRANDIYVAGNVSGTYADGRYFSFPDRCLPHRGLIQEMSCDSANNPVSIQMECAEGETCEAGVCGDFRYPRCSDNDPENDVHISGTVSVIRDAYSGTDYYDRCETEGSPQVMEYYCTEDRLSTFTRRTCPDGEACSRGVCVPRAIETPCTDSDGQDAYILGITFGVENYTTDGEPATAVTPYQQFNDLCSAALRPGPTEGVPYIVNEAYCEDNWVKYTGIECAASETCEGGICVPLPASPRSGVCEGVECPEGQFCRGGRCVSYGDSARESTQEKVKARINSIKRTLAKTEASKCGTPLKAVSEVSGDMDVTKLTAALKDVSATQARIAKCAGISGFETAPAVRASTKADASRLLAAFHSNAKTMMQKNTMPNARAKTEATKTPVDAIKTPAKASFFKRMFGFSN